MHLPDQDNRKETTSDYQLPHSLIEMMRLGNILLDNETPEHLLLRVTDTLFHAEQSYGTDPTTIQELKDEFREYVCSGYILPGTPTLTNAGRPEGRALSSCVVIHVDLRNSKARESILSYYQQNMGSGFDFTPYDDPVAALSWLNSLSAEETATGKYERYIGNMGSLSVDHPKIHEFIRAKRESPMPHFNISVVVSEQFMEAALN